MSPPLRDDDDMNHDAGVPHDREEEASPHNGASPVAPQKAATTTTANLHQASSVSNDVQQYPDVSFSHVHIYVDHVEDLHVYKELEQQLNAFAAAPPDMTSSSLLESDDTKTACRHEIWKSIVHDDDDAFEAQNRDVVKQLLVGLGFRVTGVRMASSTVRTGTKSVLVTSRDPAGVQMIVTSLSDDGDTNVQEAEEYHHFDAGNIRRYLDAHANRQGIAVLGFQVSNVDAVYERYMEKHPKLVLDKHEYEGNTKVLEVYAYYQGDTNDSEVDMGTVLRFVEPTVKGTPTTTCILPGLTPVMATFDDSCQAAYCDHWVSNVFSRTGFLQTLEDTLGFTPKVDFNAGVVAAGEAQIESTVTGNEASFLHDDRESTLKDQSQVYLPINNALSEVGHVHGFLIEIGQGIQHIASRVDDLVKFVQRGNDYREITGEGFTFLRIPRSYYGVLTKKQLTEGIQSSTEKADAQDQGEQVVLSDECADAVLEACASCEITSADGAVDLKLTGEQIDKLLESALDESQLEEYQPKRQEVLEIILRSRYTNLYSLLRHHLSDESYLGIVRNQILVDVQGEDLLYQIFTSNILQRCVGEEAPFFEFIQRVCSECKDENGCPKKLKPGCGGFGIRNFLTLFLSIEVSKAMMEMSRAKAKDDMGWYAYAEQMVGCFTNQLNESNPILTAISDAMTEEGNCKEHLKVALADGDEETATMWRLKMEAAAAAKNEGNEKLMECSSKYKELMGSIRASRDEEIW